MLRCDMATQPVDGGLGSVATEIGVVALATDQDQHRLIRQAVRQTGEAGQVEADRGIDARCSADVAQVEQCRPAVLQRDAVGITQDLRRTDQVQRQCVFTQQKVHRDRLFLRCCLSHEPSTDTPFALPWHSPVVFPRRVPPDAGSCRCPPKCRRK